MKTRIVERLAWAAACMLGVVGTSVFRHDAATLSGSPDQSVRMHQSSRLEEATPTGTVERIVARDPFRLDRRPADVPFDPDPAPNDPPPPPPPRASVPVLIGIAGPPWQAVLEGVAGRDRAVVVRAGTRLGDLTVARITADTVFLDAPDTSFTLTVRRAWR